MEVPRSSEFVMVQDVRLVARLDFARGLIGQDNKFEDIAAENQFATGLHEATRPLTRTNTADCGDERRTLSLADGTDDPDVLARRVVPQVFGGLGLATTKAAIAADAAYLRDAKAIKSAYEITSSLLLELEYEDGGHGDCGASKTVESSTANALSGPQLEAAVRLFLPLDEATSKLLSSNSVSKQRKLESGFYSGWDPAWHEDFLRQRFPHNFSHLSVDLSDKQTRGHHGRGLYVIDQKGVGFAKNSFIESTGEESFAVTLAVMKQVAYKLGTDDEERARILLGYVDDTINVGAGLVAPGMPVFD